MFSDKFHLTEAVLEGRKTMTRRIVPDGTPLGNWEETVKKSRFQPGEIVAVAQKYSEIYNHNFAFDFGLDLMPGWKNKMFVSAAECKHQIRITNIRIERLQDISDEDCMREGVKTALPPFGYYVDGINSKYPYYEPDTGFRMDMKTFRTPREAFAALIDKVSGKGTWQANPYCFVYEFELIK